MKRFFCAAFFVAVVALLAACGQKDAGTPQTPAPAGEAMTKAIEAQGAANQAAAATASAASAAADLSRPPRMPVAVGARLGLTLLRQWCA